MDANFCFARMGRTNLQSLKFTIMDVYKVLDDLKKRAAGVDPSTNKMPEGYFVSFRPIGLPIAPEDFLIPGHRSALN